MDAADAALLSTEISDGEGLPAVPLEAALRRLDKPGCGLCRWAQNALVDEIRRAPACRLDDGDGLIVVTKGGSVHYIPHGGRGGDGAPAECAHRRPFAFEPAAHPWAEAHPFDAAASSFTLDAAELATFTELNAEADGALGLLFGAARDLVELLERRPPPKQAEAAASRVRARADKLLRDGGAFGRACPHTAAEGVALAASVAAVAVAAASGGGGGGAASPSARCRAAVEALEAQIVGLQLQQPARWAERRRHDAAAAAAARRLAVLAVEGAVAAEIADRVRSRHADGAAAAAAAADWAEAEALEAAAEARAEAAAEAAAAAPKRRTLTPLYALIYDDEEDGGMRRTPSSAAAQSLWLRVSDRDDDVGSVASMLSSAPTIREALTPPTPSTPPVKRKKKALPPGAELRNN
jgi:hypothetical protein